MSNVHYQLHTNRLAISTSQYSLNSMPVWSDIRWYLNHQRSRLLGVDFNGVNGSNVNALNGARYDRDSECWLHWMGVFSGRFGGWNGFGCHTQSNAPNATHRVFLVGFGLEKKLFFLISPPPKRIRCSANFFFFFLSGLTIFFRENFLEKNCQKCD